MKKNDLIKASLIVSSMFAQTVFAEAKPVGITPDLMSVSITHNGVKTEIVRNQDNANRVIDAFAKTSRPCPPFCIQPMKLADGVETLGELEVIAYAEKMEGGDGNIMLIDSRTPDWVEKGTIPGAVNISWTELTPSKGATTEGITKVMTEQFNVSAQEGADEFAIDEAITNGTGADSHRQVFELY